MLNTPCNGRIATTVPGITSWADDTDLKCWFNLTTIASYQADYTIYNDGSTSRGTKNGGGAAVIIRGSPNQVTTIKTKGRKFTSSNEEEAAAMESTLLWTSTNTNYCSISLLFCADSKSLYEALISSNPWTSSIHNSINLILSSIFIQWIPGHSAIPGNYLANKAAKEVTNIAINAILPIFFSSFNQVINETICDDPPTHECATLMYQHHKASCDVKQIKNRKNYVLFACLQSVHHPSLQKYLHRLDPSQDSICAKCHLDEQDLRRWLCDCSAFMTIRQVVFGKQKGYWEWLATRSVDVVA